MPGDRRSVSIGSRPPDTRTTSPTYALNTRRTTRAALSQSDIETMASAVKDSESGKAFLISKLICNIDQPFTLTHLTSVLFQITQMSSNTPLPVISAIRAVAFLLKDQIACEIAELAAKQLTDTISNKLVDHVIAAIAPQVARIHTASTSLESTIEQAEKIRKSIEREKEEKDNELKTSAERIEEAADVLFSSIEDCQNSMKVLSPSLEATQDRINTMSTQITAMSTQPNPATPQPSYSSITAAHLPLTIDQAVGRAAICARQILLDPLPGKTLFPPSLTNADIASKLKDALAKARNNTTPPGNIRAVMTLRNGGIVVELESVDLANWLNSPTGRIALESNMESAVSFRTRTYPIVAEYLPIHLQIDKDDFLRRVEHENNLRASSLASIRWIKPPMKHSAEQRKAFALIQISDVHTANDILREGICIESERIEVRKDKKEPIRCAKCQKFNHIARNCTADEDTCGTCGDQHRTSACNSFRTARCTNCHSNQHTSWSRTCPEFSKRCKEIDAKYPENRMPYFPTEQAWTQVAHPLRPTKPSSPSPPSSPISTTERPRPQTARPRATRQTTINFRTHQRRRSRSPQPRQDPSIHNLISSPLRLEEAGASDSTLPSQSIHV